MLCLCSFQLEMRVKVFSAFSVTWLTQAQTHRPLKNISFHLQANKEQWPFDSPIKMLISTLVQENSLRIPYLPWVWLFWLRIRLDTKTLRRFQFFMKVNLDSRSFFLKSWMFKLNFGSNSKTSTPEFRSSCEAGVVGRTAFTQCDLLFSLFQWEVKWKVTSSSSSRWRWFTELLGSTRILLQPPVPAKLPESQREAGFPTSTGTFVHVQHSKASVRPFLRLHVCWWTGVTCGEANTSCTFSRRHTPLMNESSASTLPFYKHSQTNSVVSVACSHHAILPSWRSFLAERVGYPEVVTFLHYDDGSGDAGMSPVAVLLYHQFHNNESKAS